MIEHDKLKYINQDYVDRNFLKIYSDPIKLATQLDVNENEKRWERYNYNIFITQEHLNFLKNDSDAIINCDRKGFLFAGFSILYLAFIVGLASTIRN